MNRRTIIDWFHGRNLELVLLSALFTIFFYGVDTFFWELPIASLVVFLLLLPCSLIAAILLLFRRFRAAALRGFVCIGVLFLGVIAVCTTSHVRTTRAQGRIVKIGEACVAYREKYNRYPERLDDLAPEFISSLPASTDRFSDIGYSSHDGSEPFIFYHCLPPFGTCYYYVESRCWRFLD